MRIVNFKGPISHVGAHDQIVKNITFWLVLAPFYMQSNYNKKY